MIIASLYAISILASGNCAQSWGHFWDVAVPRVVIAEPVPAEIPAPFARTVTTGNGISYYHAVTTDAQGNMYAVGYTRDTGPFTFGPGVVINPSAASASWKNALIVKYDRFGTAIWARSVVHSAATDSEFLGVAVDSAGHPHVAGYIYNSNTFDFGNGVTAMGASASNTHFALVKYSANGIAQWATSLTAGGNNSRFSAVVVDSSGNSYASGQFTGTGSFTFTGGYILNPSGWGNGAAANWTVAKINSAGAVIWATGPTNVTTTQSEAPGVTLDLSGNVIVCGYVNTTGTLTLQPSVNINAAGTSFNALIAKHSAVNGDVLAYFTTTASGGANSRFTRCTTAPDGFVYAAGYQGTVSTMNHGTGNVTGGVAGNNALLVKYNINLGAPLWARVSSNAIASEFNAVATDSLGNIYAAGNQTGNTLATYNGTSAQAVAGFAGGKNSLVVKYDAAGNGLATRIVTAGAALSQFLGVNIDYQNSIVAVGEQANNGAYTYHNTLTISGPFATGANLAILKFTQ